MVDEVFWSKTNKTINKYDYRFVLIKNRVFLFVIAYFDSLYQILSYVKFREMKNKLNENNIPR